MPKVIETELVLYVDFDGLDLQKARISLEEEGFHIKSMKDNVIIIVGSKTKTEAFAKNNPALVKTPNVPGPRPLNRNVASLPGAELLLQKLIEKR